MQVRKELDWSLPDNEIESPQFSPDGNFIALVTRVHWPDGEEAESLPESFFTKLEQRKQQSPRFADPIVRLIDLKGNQVCEIRYGSNPAVSADNKTIVFSRQKKPLTGFRSLADTLAGNDIQLFDCEKKQARTIAEPRTGYFDSPNLLPGGKSVVYTMNEAVNGAWGGPVGLEHAELDGTKREVLLSKEVTPAVPCPPAGSAKTNLEAFMCSQPKLSSAFPNLLVGTALSGNVLIALVARPAPSAGNMYVASQYKPILFSVFPKADAVAVLPEVYSSKINDLAMQAISGNAVRIFSGYWKVFSLETKEWLPETAPQNKNPHSIYSPNGEYYVAMEPSEDEPTHFVLYRTADGQKLFTAPKSQVALSAGWSRNSARFATVAVPDGTSMKDYREVLTVYSVR